MKTKLLTICLLLFTSQVFAGHYILGTEPKTYIKGKYEILADIKVNNLHIRHVRSYAGDTSCLESDKNFEYIEVSGEINSDTHAIVKRLLKKINNNPNICNNTDNISTAVYLSSGGGFMSDGYLLGELLRKEQATTIIANNAVCYSSCAAAFLGGAYRVIGEVSGSIMFHAPYTYNSSKDISCSKRSNKLLTYMQDMIGIDNGKFLYNKTMSYCSESAGWFLNRDAAILFGIDNFPDENMR